MTSESEKKPKMSLKSKFIRGLQLPHMFDEERVLSAFEYKPRPDDIFLITYPKCGTTWTQQILHLLFHKGEIQKNMGEFFKSCPYLEALGAEAVEHMPRPGAIKMHTPFHLTPYHPSAKYIFVARNPKDCCVSFHYHTKKQRGSNFEDATFDDFFELFITGTCDYGDYFDHLLSWYPHRQDPNVLFLTYEDMKKDLRPVIRQIADFLGPEYSEMLDKEPEIVDKIIKASTVEAMKEPINKGLVKMFVDPKTEESLPEGFRELVKKTKEQFAKRGEEVQEPKVIELVRKGIIGDWKNHFTEEQNRRMDEWITRRTKGTDIMDLWKGLDL